MPNTRFLIPLATALCLGLVLCAGTSLAKRGGKHLADPSFQPSEDQKAVHSLKRQIAAEELALALQLSDEQASAVSALIKEVLSKKDSTRAAHKSAAPQMRELMEDYLDEVRSKGAASEGTLADIVALRKSMRPDPKHKGEMRKAIRSKLRDLLSEEQVQALRSFRPMAKLKPGEQRRQRKQTAHKSQDGSAEFQGEEDGPRPERIERRQRRAQRKQMKHNARDVLLSAEMLEVLSR